MSRGPGRVQRAILDLIARPDAMASLDVDDTASHPGPVGVPLAAVFRSVYNTDDPTRAQRVAVHRAIRELSSRGHVGTYQRRTCPLEPEKVTGPVPWDGTTRSYQCRCRWQHMTTVAVGRPRNDNENKAQQQRYALGMAALLRKGS